MGRVQPNHGGTMSDTTETPQDPSIVGSLSEDAKTMLAQYQHHARELTFRIGNLEVQKQDLIQQLHQTNNEARAMLQGEAKSLGIDEKSDWQVLPDGRVRLVSGD